MTNLKSIVFLANPKARKGARVLKKLQQLELPNGSQILSFGELAALSLEEARNIALIVAIGGDGTVSYACHWIQKHSLDCRLAIVPAGTGNNLAHSLQIPLDSAKALEIALHSQARQELDLIMISTLDSSQKPESYLAMQSASLGFPSEVAKRYDSLRQYLFFRLLFLPLGPFAYKLLSSIQLLLYAIPAIKRKKQIHMSGELQGQSIDEIIFALFVGNERTLGGNFIPCPLAKIDDGKADYCFIKNLPTTSYPKLFQAVSKGSHINSKDEVIYLQSSGEWQLKLSKKTHLMVDGDIVAHSSHFGFAVKPKALTLTVPNEDRGR